MATPQEQINAPAAIQHLVAQLSQIDPRFINMLLCAMGIKGAFPVLLSAGRSVNLENICWYETAERMNVEREFITLNASLIGDMDKQLNNAKRDENDEIHIVSELRFVVAPPDLRKDKPKTVDGLWILQIERVTTTPSGDFDPVITTADGQSITLTAEENDEFRHRWAVQASVADEYLTLAIGDAGVATSPENGDEISGELA